MNNITLTVEQIEEMLDKAARRGAKEALRSIGLLDDDAARETKHTQHTCLLYTSPSPRDGLLSRMPSSA